MSKRRIVAGLAMVGLMLVASVSWANPGDPGKHQTRTYFGWPSAGTYGPPQKCYNPYTFKLLGVRCCKTPCDRYRKFLRQYQIEQARHEVAMGRLNWAAYEQYVANPTPCHSCKMGCQNMKPGGCKKLKPCKNGHGGHGCQGCASCSDTCGSECGDCGGCGDDCCDEGHGKGLLGCLCKHFKKKPRVMVPPCGAPPYPEMNREQATRYLEGFQYYPPNHIIRSPRDHFMFGTKYNIGG